MYIMTQNNKNLINSFYILGFEVKETDYTDEQGQHLKAAVMAVGQNGNGFAIGFYKDEDRAKEVLMELLVNIDSMRFEMPLY